MPAATSSIEIKHRVPIWKKEFYEDGDSGWVNCEHCAAAPADACGRDARCTRITHD